MKNLSEELHLEEVEIDDGSDKKEELEKIAEKDAKDTEKELDKRAEVVDDINNAEAPEFKDDSVKDNAKGVKELKEGMKLTLDESELVEEPISDVPGLSRAYKKSRYSGEMGADLQNAKYVEMTPAEAMAKAKEEGTWQNFRILVDGRLVKFRDGWNGVGEIDDRFRVQDTNTPAYSRTGRAINDTGRMSAKQILDIASKDGNKILWTDEASVKKDPNLLAARRQNVASKHAGSFPDVNRENAGGERIRGYMYASDIPNIENSLKARRKNLKRYQDDIIDLKRRYRDGKISKDAMEAQIDEIKNGYWYSNYEKELNNTRDKAARARYYDSEIALQKNFNSFQELKDQLRDKNYDIQRAQDNIDDIKNNGSAKTNRYKSRLAEYERDLETAMRQIASLKMRLRYADDDDKEALEKATKDYNDIIARYAGAQAEFDRIMRRTPAAQATESYQPWGDAVETYSKITEANLTEDFNDLVDTLYPNGLTESRLNDLLTYKSSMILEMLDLEEENEKVIS